MRDGSSVCHTSFSSLSTSGDAFRPPATKSRLREAEEERLGGGAEDFAFRPGLLDLLQEHKSEIATPLSGETERITMAILRAVVDQGLAVDASQRSVERQAMRAVSGFLLYKE